jgi:hypothetical protein
MRGRSWAVAAVLGLLAGAAAADAPQQVAAGRTGESQGGIMTNSDQNRTGTARAKASASASASATASSGRDGRGNCSARSDTYAEARSGDERVVDRDHDEKVADGGCSAKADSRAEAGVGTRRH